MPPPKEIPGFYYDAEKNRYFPLKGPIPGSKRIPPPSTHSSSCSPDACSRNLNLSGQKLQICTNRRVNRLKASELLKVREIHGRVHFSGPTQSSFKEKYRILQVSRPVVLKYECATSRADGALEQVYGVVQTPNGLREAKFLATGNINSSINLFELGTVLEGCNNAREILPEPVWSPSGRNGDSSGSSSLERIWSLSGSFPIFPSDISCIKRVGRHNTSASHALVTTLGSGSSNGSAYILNLHEPLDFSAADQLGFLARTRVASLNRTIWTVDCNSAGNQAVLGTSVGSALLNIETRALSWLYHSRSDVLSQQFVHSGNVVLCGLRNGSIVSIDLRQKQLNHENSSEYSPMRQSSRRVEPSPLRRDRRMLNKQRLQANSKLNSSNNVSMSSSVCSLVSLASDENYFLGNSMDGSIKLYDLRNLKRGGVQSYEGQVNSHTRIQLAVDPSERFLLSGGEDCSVRIWSVKSGKLLFAEKVAESVLTAACWPQYSNMENEFGLNHSWGAWLGSRGTLFYIHGT